MRILVVKVQQIKQGLQAIVGRIWHLFPSQSKGIYAFIVKIVQVAFFTRSLHKTKIEWGIMRDHNIVPYIGDEFFHGKFEVNPLRLKQIIGYSS